MTLTRVWLPSPNFSATRVKNQLLILHTAEGSKTFHDLGKYFESAAAQVSSHVGIDDTPNMIGEYVRPANKTWTAFAANDWGEHAELCAFAKWTREEWLLHPNMLANTAAWLVEEGARYSIPLVRVNGDDIRAGKSGVCGHADVTAAGAGGNHWDPGSNFPWDAVLLNASASQPVTSPPTTIPTVPTTVPTHPLWPSRFMKLTRPMMSGVDIKLWQQKMRNRGWNIVADGYFGPATDAICRQFQTEKHLPVDGIIGPNTWNATWLTPVT